MTQRKTYTAEFKRDTAGLAQSTEHIAGTARDLGTLLSALRKWIKADQHNGDLAFPGQTPSRNSCSSLPVPKRP